MRKIIFLAVLVFSVIALVACAKKAEENTTESTVAQEEELANGGIGLLEEDMIEGEMEFGDVVSVAQAVLSDTGDDMTKNPIFDPYNAYASINKDQKEFINAAKDSDYYDFYDYDDCDVYVYAKGLNEYFTDSYSSYLQLWTKKGSTTPYKISYVDSYKGDGAKVFAEDFEYLEIALENAYGDPLAVGYVDKDGNINQGTINELIRDIEGINKSNGGFAFVEFDSGDTSVSLNAMYDPDGDIYTIFIDME